MLCDEAPFTIVRQVAAFDGFEAYRAGRWEAAKQGLSRALALRPEDAASHLLVERIRVLEADPQEDWVGVWTFESK